MKRIILCLSMVLTGLLVHANPAYRSEDVSIVNDTVRLAGTLSIPSGKAKACVVLVSGTGQQDRDGTMAGHKIFSQIAEYLLANNIAVLRTDDRGTGKSGGNYMLSTTEDFAKDALACVRFLKSKKELKGVKIGLLGHSEGGAAISIAASRSEDVKFLVSMAGLAMNGLDALLQQNDDLVANGPQTDFDKKRSNGINHIMFRLVHKYADSDSLKSKIESTYAAWKVKDDSLFKSTGQEFDHFRFPIYSYTIAATGPWYRYFIRYDAEGTMAKIKVPVLALNGDKDLMVAPKNLENWKNYIAAGGNTNVKTVLLPGLNHLFLPCVTCDSRESANIKAPVSPDALSVIASWIGQLK